jgi:4-aminobutyrate aminotransferase-like enzyme
MSRQRTHIILVVIRGTAIRITPPLTISEEEIREGCAIMLEVMKFIIESNFQELFPLSVVVIH